MSVPGSTSEQTQIALSLGNRYLDVTDKPSSREQRGKFGQPQKRDAVVTSISTLRHARTAYNDEKRYAGTIDIPLSEKGRLQAQQAATRMRPLTFDLIVTSRLRRAYETAMIISAGAIPIIRSRLCNERRFGVLEGLTWDHVQTLDPPVLMISVGNDLHTVNPQNSEPFEDVWERAKKFRRFLFRRYAGHNVLVVSHGVFLQMFHGVLRSLNCIESLAAYPGNLQLQRFDFTAERLAKESVVNLAEPELISW